MNACSAIPCSAVLLAGGKSSRMGCEKALLEIDGEPLWKIQRNKLATLSHDLLISSREGLLKEGVLDIPVIVDRTPDLGPLGGLASTLPLARHELVLVLGVDLPQMNEAFLRELLAESTPACGVIPMLEGYFEGLAAIYPRSILYLVEEILLSGDDHSLQYLNRLAVQRGLMRERIVTSAERHLFENWNLPSDVTA